MKSALSLVTLALCLVQSAPGLAFDHSGFDRFLQNNVDDKGRVAYARVTKDKKQHAALRAYLSRLDAARPDKWSRDEQLAFYINAYNALVISSVLEQGLPGSVRDVAGFFKKLPHKVAGKTLTLDDIEHKIIRPRFAEARVHFVLVCGAKSCPRLRRHALTASNLEKTLDTAAREFVPKATAVKGNTVKGSTVTTSKLFFWFAKDFEKSAGSVRAFLARYDKRVAALPPGSEMEIRFADYDWGLNQQ